VWHDFHYPFVYRRRSHQRAAERQTDNLGWSTDRSTKALLIAGGQELLREETHGIKSRRLVHEMSTYVRTAQTKTQPEAGEYADLLMAWLIAQQVALELPLRKRPGEKRVRPPAPRYSVFRRGRPV